MIHEVTPPLVHLHRCLGNARLLRWLWRYSMGQSHDALQEAVASLVSRETMAAESLASTCAERGAMLITILDPEYPASLRALNSEAPAFLYVMGDIDRLKARSIAIIGTRSPSRDGRESAGAMATGCAASNWTVVSGNAPGIDAAAHHAAVAGGGDTLVFPPAPIDQYSPSFRGGTADNTTVASPFAPGSPIDPWMFLCRNTLVATQCCAVFVAETGTRGGTLDTVKKARKFERPIFATALPDDAKFARSHAMLAAGGVALLDTTEPQSTWLPLITSAAGETLKHPATPTPILDDLFPEEFLK